MARCLNAKPGMRLWIQATDGQRCHLIPKFSDACNANIAVSDSATSPPVLTRGSLQAAVPDSGIELDSAGHDRELTGPALCHGHTVLSAVAHCGAVRVVAAQFMRAQLSGLAFEKVDLAALPAGFEPAHTAPETMCGRVVSPRLTCGNAAGRASHRNFYRESLAAWVPDGGLRPSPQVRWLGRCSRGRAMFWILSS